MENEKKKYIRIGLCAAALLLLGIYIGGCVYFHGHFFPNTTINGMDVSYITAEEAEGRIRTKVENYEIVLKQRNDRQETIEGAEIGYRYISNGEIQSCMNQQARAFWFVKFFELTDCEFEAATEYDAQLLEEKVETLECFSREIEKAPVNARMVFKETKYIIQKEEQGCKVNKKQLMAALDEAIGQNEQALDLEKAKCYETPKVTKDDKDLNTLVDNMNHYTDIEIIYWFGNREEVLDGSVVKNWLTYDKNGKVTVKDGAIQEYVAYLAEKYDTYEKPRTFKTTKGPFVTVEGGSYGWLLDQEAEAQELTKLMEEEPHIRRSPVFAETAVSRENADLGDSYVEVDLTNQHLWMYKDGKLVVESDFVSGTMNRARYTPTGTFLLYYKKSPAVLRSNRPGDSYESPVTYWMPFNDGIGLHDSSWRGSYGGEIFWNNGSHGCINLPYKAAKTIYENIEKGYPVICYYLNGEDEQFK